MHPPFPFRLAEKETDRARSKGKGVETNRRTFRSSCSCDEGRANRYSGDRWPRRPCAMPRWPKYPGAAQTVRWMDGVIIAFVTASLSARSAPLRAAPAVAASSPFGRRGGSCIRPPPGSRPAPSERQRKEKLVDSTTTPFVRPGLSCGGTVLPGTGSGARSTGPSIPAAPIRTTPVITHRRTHNVGPPVRHSGFLLTGRGRFLLPQAKENGGGFSGKPPPLGERASQHKLSPQGGCAKALTPTRPPAPKTPWTAAGSRGSASTHT